MASLGALGVLATFFVPVGCVDYIYIVSLKHIL